MKKNYTVQIKKYLKISLFALFAIFFSSLLIIYIFGYTYSNNKRDVPNRFGVSFSSRQAEKFNLNPDDVLRALLDDAGIKRFRLMSYWADIEKERGVFDYSELDKQINEIVKRNGEITLAIGLRQPRWPECFIPAWAESLPLSDYRKELDLFIKETVNRYKDNKSVTSWQLENEFHLDVFGKCPDHSRRRLIEEYQLVKSLDTTKPIIMTLSNNYFGFPTGDPRPDQFGVSVYTKVFEGRYLNNYFTYPFPSWYYSGRSGITKFLTGKDSFIHELQLEPWGPKDIWEMSLEEQDKSMGIKRIERQLDFAEDTGMYPIDLWGSEWWYWRKYIQNDPQPWEAVKQRLE